MNASQLLISYHQADHRPAQTIKQQLEARGVAVQLDRPAPASAASWPQALVETLHRVRAVAVLIGDQGLSRRQKQLISLALARQAELEQAGHRFPVVPVLLPKADLAPAFLFSDHWLDWRTELNEGGTLEALVRVATGIAGRRPPAVIVDHCPYRGLKPFREEDAAFFFGREAMVERLATALQQQGLMALVGPAGSGKTSLIQAGLLPHLRCQCSLASWWEVVYLRPGRRPFERLAAELQRAWPSSRTVADGSPLEPQPAYGHMALAGLVTEILTEWPANARLLIIIDQFEELFSLAPAAERRGFVEWLLSAWRRPSLSLLVALRAEDYGPAISLGEGLEEWLAGKIINLGPLKRPELARACQEPARLVTAALEPRLLERLLDGVDTPGEPEAGRNGSNSSQAPDPAVFKASGATSLNPSPLPLIQVCLSQLWQQHQGGLLSWAAYEKLGGLAGALGYQAEAIFNTFSPRQQEQVRQIFTGLIRPSEGGELSCQGPVNLAELGSFSGVSRRVQARKILQPLVEAGLLRLEQDEATGEEWVQLGNAILIDRWPRLRAWLDEEREFLLWRRRLQQGLIEWEQTKRRGALLQGAALAEAERWLSARPGSLAGTERAYIQQSLARRSRRGRTRWLIALAAAAILLWGLNLIAMRQNTAIRRMAAQRDVALTLQAQTGLALETAEVKRATAEAGRLVAEQHSQMALARQLAVQSGLLLDDIEDGLTPSLLLAIESLRRMPSLEGEQVLRRGLTRLLRPKAILPHETEVWTATFSPDGRRLVTRSGRVAHIWAVPGGQEVGRLELDQPLTAAAFSPDGRWLVTASLDHTVRIWDISTSFEAGVTTGREVANLRHADGVQAVAFSADGQWLATRSDQVAYVWRLTPGAVGPLSPVTTGQAALNLKTPAIARSPENGRPPVRTTMTVVGQALVRMVHGDTILAMAISPDGRWLATGGADRVARVWEVATGREVAQLAHDDVVRTVAFSPDSRLLATGSADHTARVWSLNPDATGEMAAWPADPAGLKLAHPTEVNLVAFSPDGRWLVTAGGDNLVRVWLLDLTPVDRILTARQVAQMAHTDRVWAVTFNRDGRWVATASADHTARIWLTATGREVAYIAQPDQVTDIAFSPDDRWLATAGTDHTARLWEATIGYEVTQMEHDDWVLAVAFSADGRWLASRSGKTAHIWEAATGREVARLEHRQYVNAMAFSPDGRLLATAGYDVVKVWEAATGREVAEITHGGLVRAVAFSPDERWLATAGVDRSARLWAVATGREAARLPHDNWVNALAFSPDGRWLATASDDKTARLWDVATGQEVARLPHQGIVSDVAFSPDSQWLATGSGDRTARIWLTTTVRELARLRHETGVLGVAFSPDGRLLATRNGHTVQIWDAVTHQQGPHLEHNGIVSAIVFSPDSRRLATASGDRAARVWDVAGGQEVAHLVHEYWVDAVAFSPDGRWLATASADHTARIWLLQLQDLLAEACRRLPRNLTRSEWQQYLDQEPYRPTCSNLPIPEG